MSRGIIIVSFVVLIIADIILLICSHLLSKDEYDLEKGMYKHE